MQTVSSIEIERHIDDVFRLTVDHVAEWSEVVVEDEIIEETADVVGTTFRSVTETNGNRMEFRGMITTFDPPYQHGSHLTGKLFDILVDYQFESISPERTRVTQSSTVNGKGLMKFVFFFLNKFPGDPGQAAAQKELNHLKEFCERTE